MYENIGGKIKGLAIAAFVTGAIAAVICGIIIMTYGLEMFFIGFLTMVIGPFVAWISSLVLYGFGELIDKANEIEANTWKQIYLLTNEQSNEQEEGYTCPKCHFENKVIAPCDNCGYVPKV